MSHKMPSSSWQNCVAVTLAEDSLKGSHALCPYRRTVFRRGMERGRLVEPGSTQEVRLG